MVKTYGVKEVSKTVKFDTNSDLSTPTDDIGVIGFDGVYFKLMSKDSSIEHLMKTDLTPYWVEDTNKVWVRTDIPAGSKVMYAFYDPEGNDDIPEGSDEITEGSDDTDVFQGLVAYYSFNGNVNDESGNGYNGTNYGAIPTTDRFGNNDKTMYFDGVDDYIKIDNYEPFLMENNFTISVWIKTEGDSNGRIISVGADYGAGEYGGYEIIIDSDNVPKFVVCTSTTSCTQLPAKTLINDNKWHHVLVLLKSDGTAEIYVDGIKENSLSTGNVAFYQKYVFIGANSADGGNTVNTNATYYGSIDEVRIYNRALSQSEVETLYLQTRPKDHGLVAYYPFNNNANDESGNSNDGTVYGPILTEDRFGENNKAYEFDGVNDYISATPLSEIDGTNNFTINLWFKSSSSSQQDLIEQRYAVATWGSRVYEVIMNYPSVGNIYVRRGDTGGTNIIELTSTKLWNDGEWHNLIIIHHEGTMLLYIDGNLEDSDSLLITTDTSTVFTIGCRTLDDGSLGDYFNGKLDEIRIYNRALSQTEIEKLFLETRPKDLGLVAYYKLDGDATDSSGNGNDGTVSGAVAASDRFNRSSKAMYFDGVDDSIDLGALFYNNGITTQITVSGWVKVSDLANRGVVFSVDNTGVNNRAFMLKYNDVSQTIQSFIRETTGVSAVAESGYTPNINKWYFIATTYDGSVLKIFVNGVEYGSVPFSHSGNWESDVTFAIGKQEGNYYSSFIDEVRIYNRVLTESEIKQLYQETALKFKDGDKVFEFFDDFESWKNWYDVDGGTFTQSSDFALSGSFSGKKDTNGHPAGGKIDIGTYNMNGYVVEANIYRPTAGLTGSNADSINLEYDNNGNYYSFYINHGTSPTIGVQRYDAGTNTILNSLSLSSDPIDKWNKFKITLKGNGEMEYDMNGNIVLITDTTYPTFSGIAIRNGYYYYVDNLFLRKYSSTEPTLSYSTEETGTWTIKDKTYRKRRKIVVTSNNELKNYQIDLDYDYFNDDKIYIIG